MSIASEITRIQNNIADAYTAASEKGATMPVTQNSANLASTIGTISTGGGGSGEFLVRVIDYDGSTIKEAHLNTNETFELPSAPTHTGLVFQEWSCPVPIVNGEITVTDQDIIIGPVYTTASGKCEFDITLQQPVSGLYVYLNMDGEKDWGDGTVDYNNDHTYADYGNYTIKASTWSLPGQIFGGNSSYPMDICTEARLTGVEIGQEAVRDLYRLKRITLSTSTTFAYNTTGNLGICGVEVLIIPTTITSLPVNSIYNNRQLRYCVLHSSLQNIQQNAFANDYNLEILSLPASITSIGNSAFKGVYGIERLVIPASITSIPDGMCQNCYSLKKVKFKGQVTSIGSASFSSCYLLKMDLPNTITTIGDGAFEYVWSFMTKTMPSALTSIGVSAFANVPLITADFSNATSVPTLAAMSDLGNPNEQRSMIKVPTALYNTWIAATNWSSLASYIVAV